MQQEMHLGVDTAAQKLLELIAIADDAGSPMTVTQTMARSDIASAATIHRKIMQLIQADLVSMKFESHNRRTKYLVPTIKAQDYFEGLGDLMIQLSK